jgi:hypothetical protein
MKIINFFLLLFIGCSVAIAQQTNNFPQTGNVEIYQPGSGYRAYDVINKFGLTVSRFEATSDASGQLWLRNATGDTRVYIRSSNSFPSSIAGEFVVGEYTTASKGKAFYVNGTSHFTRFLTCGSNIEITQVGSAHRAYDVRNREGSIVSRFEATSDASGQLWLKNASNEYRVYIRSSNSLPSSIAGEFVVGEYATASKGKTFYVNGDSWMNGRLDVNGIVRSEEVTVEIVNPPDYVFEPGYESQTLEEIKDYIAKNKHLPEIPSAKEMETDGINLGDMNMRLLKKIEELTLAQIDLMEKLKKQNERIQELEKKIGKNKRM